MGDSHFCRCYRDWKKMRRLSMRQEHRAGEKLFIDSGGPTLPVVNPETGECRGSQNQDTGITCFHFSSYRQGDPPHRSCEVGKCCNNHVSTGLYRVPHGQNHHNRCREAPFTDGRDALAKILLSLQLTDKNNIYATPDSMNEGRGTLNLSVAGEAIVTVLIPGEAPVSVTLTPVSQLWQDICNAPALAAWLKPWRDWAGEYAPGENRTEALRIMTECMLSRCPKMDLNNLGLTRLPGCLPPWLRILDVSHNRLTLLPGVLPASLTTLDVSHNYLGSLPALPIRLTTLDVSHNHLRYLSYALPAGLTTLDVSHNGLRRLPDTLPAGLTTLDVSHNGLRRLPDALPASLTSLDMSHNHLESLPNNLPAGLTALYVSHNDLQILPALPAGLTILDVSHNRLERLPGILPAGLSFFALRNNTLSLTIIPSRNDTLTRRPDILSVTRWFPALRQEAQKARWQPLLEEENAAAFTLFLSALHNSISASNETFCTQVQVWLDELFCTPPLRQLTFGLALEACESCADRAALGWNTMQTARLLYHAEQNPDGCPPQDFFRLSEQIFCIQKINDIATEKVKSSKTTDKDTDAIEVWLGYFSQLKGALGLPDLFVNDMNFSTLSPLTADDITAAMNRVRDDKARNFLTWLEGWEPCQKYVCQTLNITEDERDALAERRLNMYDAELKKIISEADISSPEVAILAGLQATESANKAIFGPLIANVFYADIAENG